ncbi:hypothetical protein SAMN05428949_5584 [Chitinophaga sp. YR627]|uniref:hypothetical protein n=1 Tax=Chitinophaga sp. YR627 TaxID=1881041 RepID=UPI0008E14F42|nr:hypothetical protein [Chitinophaga sp. YR627]SFO52737.1 hypothetical protein SAMN05428949_5584 [Chitinophaga sp. YR627]
MKKSTISVVIVVLLLGNARHMERPATDQWLKIDPKGQLWQSRDGINWTMSNAQSIYRLADGSMLLKQNIEL